MQGPADSPLTERSISLDQRSELAADAQRVFGPHALINTPFLVHLVQLFVTSLAVMVALHVSSHRR